MKRRTALQGLIALAAMPLLPACSRAAVPAAGVAPVKALDVPASFWRDKVSPAAWKVLFQNDTERSGSSPLDHEKRIGTFVCAACYLPLFASQDKFDSGTGWPSFTHGIPGHTVTKRDFMLIIPRTEYHCARCGGHQGHIFDDGPKPLGTRWCNNGLSLRFVPKAETLPALRG
ncbi:MAG: peptide-methionine (R)-S-oxide reductase MsrB [Luteimonas sp.]|nr:peptide-methionine (R)-S-oxide reductase MsrB [Luteimonas sp.]